MKKLSGGQRGNTVALVLMGLIVAAAVVALGRGCDEESAPNPSVAGPPPAAPLTMPAFPAPAPAAEQASAAETAAVAPPGVPALVVHNPCDQPLLMAVNFGNANGSRSNAGFFQVGRGARLTPAASSGPIYLYDKTIYFYTETLATEPVELGRRDETVGDRRVGMKEVALDLPAASAITLECPGSTSGRP